MSQLSRPLTLRAFGRREDFGLTVETLIEALLLEAGERPLGSAVKFAFLLGENFGEHLIDDAERSADAHSFAIGLKDLGESRRPPCRGRLKLGRDRRARCWPALGCEIRRAVLGGVHLRILSVLRGELVPSEGGKQELWRRREHS